MCVKQTVIHIVLWNPCCRLVPFTIFLYVIWWMSDMKSEGNMFNFKVLDMCTPWKLCETTTANFFFGCYLLSSSVDRSFLWLSLITFENRIQIHHTVLNATKHKPSWCIFSKAGHLTLTQSLSPEKRSGSLTLSPAFSFTFKVATDRPECKLDGEGLHRLWALINGDSEGFWGLAVTQG